MDAVTVSDRLSLLTGVLPATNVFYAVKANPDFVLLKFLVSQSVSFDVASPAETDLVLAAGALPDRVSYGNTAKSSAQISYVFSKGVRKFVVDSFAQVDLVSRFAPGSSVFVRVHADSDSSVFSLSSKFGVFPRQVPELVRAIVDGGLRFIGLSFHAGSQQRSASGFAHYGSSCADLLDSCISFVDDVVVKPMLNFGGGLPAYGYGDVVDPAQNFLDVLAPFTSRFDVVVEPGRFLSADAGVLATRVVCVSDRDGFSPLVVLGSGYYSGLMEASSVRHQVLFPESAGSTSGFVLTGPTWDSVDVLDEGRLFEVPNGVAEGDLVLVLSAGAYAQSVSSVGFNGFNPPEVEFVPADIA